MEEMPRDFKGVWIPKEIYLDERLSALDKIIFTEINSLDGEEGCFASNEYLAKFCQCSEAKITKSIALLKKLGYLYVKKFDGRRRFLGACIVKNTVETSKKYEAEWEKVRHSNIDSNIERNNTTNVVLSKSSKESYGNEEINAAFDEWERIFGYKQKQSKQNRFAVYNMLRAKDKGAKWLSDTMHILHEAQKDKFAGNYILGIAGFADLQQRYDSVWKWGSNKYAQTQEAQKSIYI